MSFNIQQTFQRFPSLKRFGILLFIPLSSSAFAVQPMSESDLEVVSATTGSNILSIFGASQAGLKIDDSDTANSELSSTKLNTENFNEGEATKSIALHELRTIEEDNFQIPSNNTEQLLLPESQRAVLKINEQTTGNASVFSTSSEINYKTSNVNHQMRNIENGGIGVTRDLQIDLLKLENLRGDGIDDGRSAGSIYLSDWNSQGDTRIFTSK